MTKKQRHGYSTLDAFVRARISQFDEAEHSFKALFELMFIEDDRLFYERSEGCRIIGTTYGEAKREILILSGILREKFRDLPYNSVVGICMENSLLWIETFWALLLCGKRPLLMNLRLDNGTLDKALSDSRAVAVISDNAAFSVNTIPAGELSDLLKDRAKGAAGPEGGTAEAGKDNTDDTGTEILLMSSGSSGSLKLCAYGAEEFYWQIHASGELVKSCARVKKHYDGYLKQLLFLPLYHIFGLVAVYIWFAFFSCAFVQLNDLSPATITGTISRHKVTHIFAVPLFWELVYKTAMQKIKERGEDVSSRFQKGMAIAGRIGDIPALGDIFCRRAFREVREQIFGDSVKFCITGGSEISGEVLSFFNNIGCDLSNGYGMSEIGISSVELSTKRSLRNSGEVGKPLPSVEYRIAEDGELLIRSRAAARYIIEDGKRLDRSGWYHTGDLAECKNGRYRIMGRRDDLVISPSGENLNPGFVEPHFNLDGIDRACLINASPGGPAEPVLLMSVGWRVKPDEFSSIQKSVMQRAGELKLEGQIRRFVFVADDLMGPQEFKLNRRTVAKRYASGKFTEVTGDNCGRIFRQEDTPVASKLRELFADALGLSASDISDDLDFFADGSGTSLDYLVLIAQIEDEFGISFPASEQTGLVTVTEFARFVEASGGTLEK